MNIDNELMIPIYKETKHVRAFYIPYSQTFVLYVRNQDSEEWKNVGIKMKDIHQIDTRVRGVIRRFYRKHA